MTASMTHHVFNTPTAHIDISWRLIALTGTRGRPCDRAMGAAECLYSTNRYCNAASSYVRIHYVLRNNHTSPKRIALYFCMVVLIYQNGPEMPSTPVTSDRTHSRDTFSGYIQHHTASELHSSYSPAPARCQFSPPGADHLPGLLVSRYFQRPVLRTECADYSFHI